MPRNIVIGQKVSNERVRRAKELRRNMTEAENILWQRLRANRLNGWHFRRQQIIGGFFADFYCHAAALVVEVDGEIHKSQQEYDKERADLIRFTNEQIKNHLPDVLQTIDRLCRERASTSPAQRSERQPPHASGGLRGV